MDSVYRNGGKAGGVFKSQDYKGITKALRECYKLEFTWSLVCY